MLMRLRSWAVDRKRRALYRRCLAAASRAVLLRYHSVGDPASVTRYADPSLSLPPDRFREHLDVLRQRFRVVSLDAVLARVASRESGEPLAAITFDDGYRDNHDVALALLEEAGVVATFFVTSRPLEPGRWFWISELRRLVPRLPNGRIEIPSIGLIEVTMNATARDHLRRDLTRRLSAVSEVEREGCLDCLASAANVARGDGLEGTFLTPEHLKDMVGRGMAIGAHTRSHPHLDRIPPREIREEIQSGKRALEDVLGLEVRHFAYPNPAGGQSNGDEVRSAVLEAGFRSAVTSVPGPLDWRVDAFELPRLGVYAGGQEKVLFDCIGREPTHFG